MKWETKYDMRLEQAYQAYLKREAKKDVAVCRNYGSCNQRGAGCSACSDNSCNLRVVKED